MNRKKRKTALILLVAVLCVIVLLGIRGTRKTIDKTVPARVYEDNGTTYAPSSITISGTLKKTWSSTSFVGTFAMDGYEPRAETAQKPGSTGGTTSIRSSPFSMRATFHSST